MAPRNPRCGEVASTEPSDLGSKSWRQASPEKTEVLGLRSRDVWGSNRFGLRGFGPLTFLEEGLREVCCLDCFFQPFPSKVRKFPAIGWPRFQLHPAGPWRAHFVGCHEHCLITTKTSDARRNTHGGKCRCWWKCLKMSTRVQARILNSFSGYWSKFKLWLVFNAKITCPWKKGNISLLYLCTMRHHWSDGFWWCRYLHTIWCILMAWKTCQCRGRANLLTSA